jgi:hypothetical protein
VVNLKNGKNYMRNQDLDKAVTEFKTALELAESIGDRFEEKKAARGLGSFLPDSDMNYTDPPSYWFCSLIKKKYMNYTDPPSF